MTVMFLFLLEEEDCQLNKGTERVRGGKWITPHACTHTHTCTRTHATAINGNPSLPWTIYSSQWNELIWAM